MSNAMRTLQKWAVEVEDSLQDGRECQVVFFRTKDDALAYINDREEIHAPSITSTYRLWEIVVKKYHPLDRQEIEVPQPPIRKVRIVAKKGKE